MRFTVGIDFPANPDQAFGLVVPALCDEGLHCVSAADTREEIRDMVIEVVQMLAEGEGLDLRSVTDLGVAAYRDRDEYRYCTEWYRGRDRDRMSTKHAVSASEL